VENQGPKVERSDPSGIPDMAVKGSGTDRTYKDSLLKVLMISAGPFLYFFGFYHIFKGNYTEGVFDLTMGAVTTLGYIAIRRNKGSLIAWRFLIVAIGGLFLYFLTIQADMPNRALWAYLYPLLALFVFEKKEGVIWAAVFFFLVAGLLFASDFHLAPFTYDPGFRARFLITLGLVSVMAFIFETAREKAESKMLRQKKRLEESESRYRKAYEKLNETQVQLIQSAKLASIGELASGVAHELNQPLMVIRGSLQLIQRNLQKNDLKNDELTGQFDLPLKNTKRMMNIINHLRSFSRQSKGGRNRLSINKVIKDSFTLINEQLRLHNIEVMATYTSDLPPIQGDENQLEQVMINLIANARDAMDKREEVSEIDENAEKILKISTSRARDNGNWVEIMIGDSGEGIPDGDLDRIFDPFFTTKEVGKGTGLGLSISYGIIKDHQGEIEVAETGPAGTIFRMRLPVSKPGRDQNLKSLE